MGGEVAACCESLKPGWTRPPKIKKFCKGGFKRVRGWIASANYQTQ